jgi:hypothetical protein
MSYRRRARIYHHAINVSGRGISALCYNRPHRIDLSTGRYGWTFLRAQVTCTKCLERLIAQDKQRALEHEPSSKGGAS